MAKCTEHKRVKDVLLNPGPDNIHYHHQPYRNVAESDNTDSSYFARRTYSRTVLLELQTKQDLYPFIYKHIKSLGIEKHRRGCKAGRRRQSLERRGQVCKVVINVFQRKSCFNGVNAANLIKVQREYVTSKTQNVRFTLWNACSVDKKLQSVSDSIVHNCNDVFLLTETWFRGNDSSINARFASMLTGYRIHQVPRSHRKGGGVHVAVIFKSSLIFTPIKTSVFETFEVHVIDGNLYISRSFIRLLVVYRPPNGNFVDFLNEFVSLLEGVLFSQGRLLIVGDFNIHVDNPADSDALKFINLLYSMGLSQHVICPTHNKGHTLDLIITRTADSFVTDLKCDWLLPSDHAALHFSTTFTRPSTLKITRTFRKLAQINIDDLQQKITSSLESVVSYTGCNPSDLVDNYNYMYTYAMTSVINELAPVITKDFLDKVRAPWFTEQLLDARKGLRQLERRWRKSALVVHEQIFKFARCLYVSKLRDAHASYHRDRIVGANTKTLFRVIDDITGSKRALSLVTPDLELLKLPEMFANYFRTKIETIRKDMPSVKLLDPVSDSSFCLSYFEPVSVQFVKRLISKMSSKSSALDPMPTKLLKKCLQQVVPVITRIINSSLESGKFPDSCKSAIVRPLLKKQGLDINILRNYRPISNLPYIAKLIEKTVLVQVNSYLCQNNLYAKCQSAYRVSHSTETALLRVQIDVLHALDIQNEVILVLLDLSSAFDTIDHDILLHRLCCRFKIDGVVLEWIRSYMYLRGRTQRVHVCVGSVVSEAQFLDCGVPQGSVLDLCCN